jgi:zinc and cadmium transporter
MSTFAWILVGGIAMSCLALVGGVTVILPEKTLQRIVMPLVALAAGSLLGGAVFHMLPSTVDNLGNDPAIWAWLVGGFVTFFFLEQFLHWHHCHRPMSQHGPLGYLILLADGTHNFIGGLAVAGSFIVDIRLGIVTWLVAAAHEVPQELGDFGILVHSGWSPRRALIFNFASAITFLVGGLVAFWASGTINVAFLVPFAAGNFIYIAAADLLPQITSTAGCGGPEARAMYVTREKVEQSLAFIAGLALLYVSALLG